MKLDTSLARQILIALGLVPACGGKATIDGSGAGGAGGSATHASASTVSVASAVSTGSGLFQCNVPLPEHAKLQYACLTNFSSCPPKEDPQVMSALTAQLAKVCSDPDTCWCYGQDPDFCSCYDSVIGVPCGPDPSAESGCCYYAMVSTDLICEGRPFMVAGVARTASLASGTDWLASATPCVDDLAPPVRRALADAWAKDALAEHASVASFARFVLELMAVGAPAALVRDASRALHDEVRHAEIGFALASAYAGHAVGPGPLSMEGAAPATDIVTIAAATAREGCINETLAALCARAAADGASDVVVRAALDEIATDEARHAELAWRFVAWAVAHDSDAKRAVEEVFASIEIPPVGASDEAVLTAHGQLSARRRAEIVRQGLETVVIPCASALLRSTEVARIATERAGV